MAITTSDIKLFQSQDNTDNDNGGGSRTGVEVADGQVNNLFSDISRIDSVNGDIALRKVFPVVNTDNRDIYHGAHSILRKTPADPKVSALIFYTNDSGDTRIEAQDKIEAYVAPSYKASFYMYGNVIAGSRALTVLQRLTDDIPNVGDVYLLTQGVTDEYVRIANIESREITLSYNSNDYVRRRVIITTEQPLVNSFTGSTFHPDGQLSNTADIYATQVANAAKFYGTKVMTDDALIGATEIQVESMFEQLVPSATQQRPIVNAEALRQSELLISSPDIATVSESISVSGNTQTVTLKNSIVPGSLTTGYGYDDGNGNYIRNYNGLPSATINYAEGTLTGTYGASGGVSFSYRPADVYNTRVQFSDSIYITRENQGSVYIRNVSPVPSPSDCYIDYRTNGKWVRIPSNFDGTLGNDPSIGAGLIQDNGDGTASITVTLGANPDLNSTVIFSWGSDTFIQSIIDYANSNFIPWVEIDLQNKNVDPSSVVLSYYRVNSGTLDMTFDANGKYYSTNYNTKAYVDGEAGKVYIAPITSYANNTNSVFIPNFTSANHDITLQYNYANEPTTGQPGALTVINSPAFVGSVPSLTFAIGETVEVAGLKLAVTLSNYANGEYRSEGILIADADGVLRLQGGSNLALGTVNSNGDVSINLPNRTIRRAIYGNVTRPLRPPLIGSYTTTDIIGYENVNLPIYQFLVVNQLEYRTAQPATFANSYNQLHDTRLIGSINIQTLPECIGDVNFWIDDSSYLMKAASDNVVYNSNGSQAGAFNRQTGLISITHNDTSDLRDYEIKFTKIFGRTKPEEEGIRFVNFRTSTDDLVTSSLLVRYTTVNGTFLAVSNANGEIVGTDLDPASNVDTDTGAVMLVFTADVDPSTIKYDCVAETTLPLDPVLLGLNPVRLPPNGKVPVFDAGRTLVIFEEQETDIVGTPTAGQTISLARQGQSYIEVIDLNGQRLDYAQYTADRVNGTITFADPLSLVDRNGNALTGPYRVIDRIEDMVLCTAAEITGLLSISSPLTHNYPKDTTKVASALVWGDVGSRVFNIFSQQSFDIWSDERTKPAIAAQYDNVNYPIQINNKDSYTGRWAFVFKSSTTVDVQEETLGVVLTNVSISTDIQPINPATGNPYFTVLAGGWGAGWVTSNVLRFNTESGSENMWIIRTVQSGALTEANDSIEIEIRGDAN